MPANIPFVLLGTGMLWFGWFGFNAGLGAGGQRHGGDGLRHDQHGVGGGDAGLDVLRRGARPQAVGPRRLHRRRGRPGRHHAGGGLRHHRCRASSSASSRASISNLAVHLKTKSTLDDTLDVFPCHGVGGIVGMIATGVFAQGRRPDLRQTDDVPVHTAAPGDRRRLLVRRLVLLYKVTDRIIPLRVTEEQEDVGLDLSQHGESHPQRRRRGVAVTIDESAAENRKPRVDYPILIAISCAS